MNTQTEFRANNYDLGILAQQLTKKPHFMIMSDIGAVYFTKGVFRLSHKTFVFHLSRLFGTSDFINPCLLFSDRDFHIVGFDTTLTAFLKEPTFENLLAS